MHIDKNGCFIDIAQTPLSFLYFLNEKLNISFEIREYDNKKIVVFASEDN